MGFLSAFFPNNEEDPEEHAKRGQKLADQFDAQVKASDEKYRHELANMSPVERATHEAERAKNGPRGRHRR